MRIRIQLYNIHISMRTDPCINKKYAFTIITVNNENEKKKLQNMVTTFFEFHMSSFFVETQFFADLMDVCLTYCFLILCTLIRIPNDDFYKVWTYSNIFFRLRSAFCHGHVYICTVYCIVRYILNELLKSISRIFHLMHNLKNTPFLINSI